MKTTQKSIILLSILLFSSFSVSHAAGFDCRKAASFVEKAICANKQLSALDDDLTRAYQKAFTENALDRHGLKLAEQAWLDERNHCQNNACVKAAYQRRIAELDSTELLTMPHVVLGRCHLNSCWWWGIVKTQTLETRGDEKIVNVRIRTTEALYPDDAPSDVYPPIELPHHARWTKGTQEKLIFCSSKLPAMIDFDEEKKTLTAFVPFFNNQGSAWGYSEGDGNLYFDSCAVANRNGEQAVLGMSAKTQALAENGDAYFPLKQVQDVFKLPR